MSKYVRKMNEGTGPYRLGRLNRSANQSWNEREYADYERGKKDLRKLNKKRSRNGILEWAVAIPVGVTAAFLLISVRAIVVALPFLIVLYVASRLF
jgi:hypothetical protein